MVYKIDTANAVTVVELTESDKKNMKNKIKFIVVQQNVPLMEERTFK